MVYGSIQKQRKSLGLGQINSGVGSGKSGFVFDIYNVKTDVGKFYSIGCTRAQAICPKHINSILSIRFG